MRPKNRSGYAPKIPVADSNRNEVRPHETVDRRRRSIGTCRLSIAALWRNGRLVLQLRKLHPARLLLKCGIPKPVARQEKFQRLDLSKTTDKVHEIHPGHYSPGTDLAR